VLRVYKWAGLATPITDRTAFMRGRVFQRRQAGKGLLSLGLWVTGIPIIGLFGFEGLKVAYRYYDLKNYVGYVARTADVESDGDLRKKVAGRLKRSGTECLEQDIVIERQGGLVRLVVPYKHEIGATVAGFRYAVFPLSMRVRIERKFDEPNVR